MRILCSAWMSKDLEVDQEMKTGKQKGKEAACCCVLLAYLRGELKQVQEVLGFLVMWCEAGLGYLWFIRTARIYHHPIKSRGSGNGLKKSASKMCRRTLTKGLWLPPTELILR